MGRETFSIEQDFRAPVNAIFAELADHEAMGRLFGMPMKRIKDADPNGAGGVNGLGSVRSLGIFPITFEETITAFEPDRLIEYSITRGGPLKHHLGRMEFSEKDGRTFLTFTMELEPKVDLPGVAFTIKTGMREAVGMGLRKLRERYEADQR